MKRTYSLFFASYLLISSSLSITGWGQTKPPKSQPPKPVTAPPVSFSIQGTIIDAATRSPIPGAFITIRNKSGNDSDKQQVGQDGVYNLILRSREDFHTSVTATGYDPIERDVAAPTSAYTNDIRGYKIAMYRIGTQPATQTTIASASTPPKTQPAPASTSLAATSSPAAPPAQQPAAVASNQAAGNNSQSSERVVPPKTLDAKVTYTPPLVVAPKGKATQLQALQFVQSKSELLPEAQGGLEQLLQFMQQHPTAEIELSGHTDNQGDFDKNVQLSKERVDVVKSYLVQNGIAANRINTRGYGPTRPIASNNSEATRRLNRRVELILLKQ
jgi:outer membrane protein OmpA-like peptidoglycan-associated protein